MLIENQRVQDILVNLSELESELSYIRSNCKHVMGEAESVPYNGSHGHVHIYNVYECKLCGEWLDEEKIQ